MLTGNKSTHCTADERRYDPRTSSGNAPFQPEGTSGGGGGVLTGHSYNVFPDFPSTRTTCKLLFLAPSRHGLLRVPEVRFGILFANVITMMIAFEKIYKKKNTFKVHAVFFGTRLHFTVFVWLSRLPPYLLKTIENFRRSNTTKQLRHVYTLYCTLYETP